MCGPVCRFPSAQSEILPDLGPLSTPRLASLHLRMPISLGSLTHFALTACPLAIESEVVQCRLGQRMIANLSHCISPCCLHSSCTSVILSTHTIDVLTPTVCCRAVIARIDVRFWALATKNLTQITLVSVATIVGVSQRQDPPPIIGCLYRVEGVYKMREIASRGLSRSINSRPLAALFVTCIRCRPPLNPPLYLLSIHLAQQVEAMRFCINEPIDVLGEKEETQLNVTDSDSKENTEEANQFPISPRLLTERYATLRVGGAIDSTRSAPRVDLPPLRYQDELADLPERRRGG